VDPQQWPALPRGRAGSSASFRSGPAARRAGPNQAPAPDDSGEPARAEDSAEAWTALRASDPGAADRLDRAAAQMPRAGEQFLGFRLYGELGRGAFGRVFLARQGDLAHRWVALKVAPDLWGESQTLAQLQHTHIVPIYSVHQAGPLQAVCMPYFGAT